MTAALCTSFFFSLGCASGTLESQTGLERRAKEVPPELFGEPETLTSLGALTGGNEAAVNLSGVNLSGMNLSGLNLAGFNLGGTNLAGFNLAGFNLSGTNLGGNNLAGFNLAASNLAGFNLAGFNLAGFNLAGFNLGSSNLSGSNVMGAYAGQGCPVAGSFNLGTDVTVANVATSIHGSVTRNMLLSGEDVYARERSCIVMGIGSVAFARLIEENRAAGSAMYAALKPLSWGIAGSSGGPMMLKAWEVVVWGSKSYSVFIVPAPPAATWAGVAGFVKAVFRWSAPPTMTIQLGEIGGGSNVQTHAGMMDAGGKVVAGTVNAKDFVAGLLGFVTATTNNRSVMVDFSAWVRKADGTGQILGNVSMNPKPTYSEASFAVLEKPDGTVQVVITTTDANGSIRQVTPTQPLIMNAEYNFRYGKTNSRPVPVRCAMAQYISDYALIPVEFGKCDSGLRSNGSANIIENATTWTANGGTSLPFNDGMLMQGSNPSLVYKRCADIGRSWDEMDHSTCHTPTLPVLSETYVFLFDQGYGLEPGDSCGFAAAECGTIPSRLSSPTTLSCDSSYDYSPFENPSGGCATGLTCHRNRCVAAAMNEVEINSSYTTANPISVNNTVVTGYLMSKSDDDYFRFTLPAGETVELTLRVPRYEGGRLGPLDFDIELWEKAYTPGACGDFGGERNGVGVSVAPPGVNESITYTNTTSSPQVLTARVFPCDYSTTRPYFLNIRWARAGAVNPTPVADTSPPSTSITAPTASATVSGVVTVSANASDNFGVTRVDFFMGTTLIGSDTTAPYSVSWNTAGVPNGSQYLTSKAYDAANNAGASAWVSVMVSNVTSDTLAPTTSLTAPTAGATVSGLATLSANASDNVAVTKVEFYRGSTLIGTDTTSPYSISWDTTAVANGSYSLTSKAYDAANLSTSSAAVSVNVSNGTATAQPVTWVPLAATWKYLDNGTNAGTSWRATAFYDSGWKSGVAPLGYGAAGTTTLVSYGSNSSYKYITTYFRKAFSIADKAKVQSLSFRMKVDDGAVVYLNGVEVYRKNLPTTTIAYTTPANAYGDPSTFTATTALPVSALQSGANVLAIEVHQYNGSSPDLFMEAELTGTAFP